MSKFQQYIHQGPNIYAIWSGADNHLFYATSIDNGQHWESPIAVCEFDPSAEVHFHRDDFGTIYVVSSSFLGSHLYTFKKYDECFSSALVEHSNLDS